MASPAGWATSRAGEDQPGHLTDAAQLLQGLKTSEEAVPVGPFTAAVRSGSGVAAGAEHHRSIHWRRPPAQQRGSVLYQIGVLEPAHRPWAVSGVAKTAESPGLPAPERGPLGRQTRAATAALPPGEETAAAALCRAETLKPKPAGVSRRHVPTVPRRHNKGEVGVRPSACGPGAWGIKAMPERALLQQHGEHLARRKGGWREHGRP